MNYYAVIPSFILLSKELTDAEKIMCGLIAGLSEKAGYCYADNEKLAEYVGKTPNATQAIIKRLYSKDILKNLGGKFDRKLKLNYIVSEDDIKSQNDFLEDKSEDTKSQIDSLKSQNDFSTILYINKKETMTESSSDSVLSFEEWYSVYPRKEQRKRAEIAFNKLTKKEKSFLLQATLLHIDHKTEKNEIFQHPTTFLNSKTFYDYQDKIETNEGAKKIEVKDCPLLRKIEKLVESYKALDGATKEKWNEREWGNFKTKDGGLFDDEEMEMMGQVGGTFGDWMGRGSDELLNFVRGMIC